MEIEGFRVEMEDFGVKRGIWGGKFGWKWRILTGNRRLQVEKGDFGVEMENFGV